MTNLSPSQSSGRATRAHLAETIPAVLRLKDGGHIPGKLRVISLTSGLVCLSQPPDQGPKVKLMFLSSTGLVLGAAEMLSPISWSLQPFRFVRLFDEDQRRVKAAIESSIDESRRDHERIERSRAW